MRLPKSRSAREPRRGFRAGAGAGPVKRARGLRVPGAAGPADGPAGRWALAGPFLAAAAVLLLFVLLLPVRYETNDDFAIIRQINPRNGFGTDPHIYYLSWGMTRLLLALYHGQPGVPWFGLTLYAGLCLGAGLFLGVAWRAARGRESLLWLPALALLLAPCALMASFTSASMILLFGALLGALEWRLRGNCPLRSRRAYALLLSVALLLALSLRWKLTLTSLAFGLPLLLFTERRLLVRMLPVALALLALAGGDRLADRLTGDEAWRAYERYNQLRASFHDTIAGDFHEGVTEGALEQAGWSRADYETYRRWVIYDDTLFNAATLSAFLDANRLGHEGLLATVLSKVRRSASRYWSFIAVGLLSLLALGVHRAPRWKGVPGRWRPAAALGAITAGVVLLLGYRFTARVALPLLAYWVAAGALLLSVPLRGARAEPEPAAAGASERRPREATRTPAGRARGILAVLLIAVVGILGWVEVRDVWTTLRVSARLKSRAQAAMRVAHDRAADPDLILVPMDAPRGLRLECVHPLKEFSDVVPVKMFLGGTAVHSPRYNAILESLGLAGGRELMRWMVDNPHVWLALEVQGERQKTFWEYLWLSYIRSRVVTDVPTALQPVVDLRGAQGEGYVFYRLIRQPS